MYDSFGKKENCHNGQIILWTRRMMKTKSWHVKVIVMKKNSFGKKTNCCIGRIISMSKKSWKQNVYTSKRFCLLNLEVEFDGEFSRSLIIIDHTLAVTHLRIYINSQGFSNGWNYSNCNRQKKNAATLPWALIDLVPSCLSWESKKDVQIRRCEKNKHNHRKNFVIPNYLNIEDKISFWQITDSDWRNLPPM